MKMEFISIGRRALGALGIAGMVVALSAPSQAQRTQVVPYLEAQQVLSADLNSGDVLTYTSVAAGVDARTQTRRVEAQISYRYEHRVAWEDNLADQSVHSGLARCARSSSPTPGDECGALAPAPAPTPTVRSSACTEPTAPISPTSTASMRARISPPASDL
jgi:hypothetical protein